MMRGGERSVAVVGERIHRGRRSTGLREKGSRRMTSTHPVCYMDPICVFTQVFRDHTVMPHPLVERLRSIDMG